MILPPRKRKDHSAWDRTLIPLINVVFILMVFFVVCGRIQSNAEKGLDIPLSTIGQATNAHPVELSLRKDGMILLDGKPVQREGLYASLQLVFLADRDNPLTIRADRGLPAHYLLSALQLVKRAGGRNITLVTRR